jgi:hypothetical protein
MPGIAGDLFVWASEAKKKRLGINAAAQELTADPQSFVALVGNASFGCGIGVIGKENDMTNWLRFVAACFLSVFLLSGLTGARAADPGFCRQYAKAALGQVRVVLADPRCGAGVQGVRWSTDFSLHYEWCLGASLDVAGAESDARTRYSQACARQ